MKQPQRLTRTTTLVDMAHPRHNLHLVLVALGVIGGGLLAVVTGGDPWALSLATGGTTGISYWLGAHSHRKHG